MFLFLLLSVSQRYNVYCCSPDLSWCSYCLYLYQCALSDCVPCLSLLCCLQLCYCWPAVLILPSLVLCWVVVLCFLCLFSGYGSMLSATLCFTLQWPVAPSNFSTFCFNLLFIFSFIAEISVNVVKGLGQNC